METVLQGAKGVVCYLDDMLVTGSTKQEHLKKCCGGWNNGDFVLRLSVIFYSHQLSI